MSAMIFKKTVTNKTKIKKIPFVKTVTWQRLGYVLENVIEDRVTADIQRQTMEDKHKRRNRNRRCMINRIAIQQWSEHAPWIDNAQIEQDLIICRALKGSWGNGT